MKNYICRIVDEELDRALGYAGAVVIRGPKASGKTPTDPRAVWLANEGKK